MNVELSEEDIERLAAAIARKIFLPAPVLPWSPYVPQYPRPQRYWWQTGGTYAAPDSNGRIQSWNDES